MYSKPSSQNLQLCWLNLQWSLHPELATSLATTHRSEGCRVDCVKQWECGVGPCNFGICYGTHKKKQDVCETVSPSHTGLWDMSEIVQMSFFKHLLILTAGLQVVESNVFGALLQTAQWVFWNKKWIFHWTSNNAWHHATSWIILGFPDDSFKVWWWKSALRHPKNF